ncbi:MAG TPA: c-type cytochrome [Chitinophagaceae bacterium]|nr:c-type cytochrome [Chitinophagaceae bacterium]
MNFFKTPWLFLFIVCLLVLIGFIFIKQGQRDPFSKPHLKESAEWQTPDDATIPEGDAGNLIRYGKELIAHTAVYLGPKGKVAAITNGMNCQNCHLEAGTKNFANPFSAVAATYPRYRPRSGTVETVQFRINDCMVRSLNSQVLDSQSREMQAMAAYINWVGSGVRKGTKPVGSGIEPLPFLPVAADTVKGEMVYRQKCQRCHGRAGEGLYEADSVSFVIPPLWGAHSYNTGAGLYRLFQFATYVKNNMPFGATFSKPQLTTEEAWHVAAFVNGQPRPRKVFAADWPDITKKPIDFPFGPYADTFSETQHKYGPFAPMQPNVTQRAN